MVGLSQASALLEAMRLQLGADTITACWTTGHGAVEIVADGEGPPRIVVGGEDVPRDGE